MKKNPCFECICNPICRHKCWTQNIMECKMIHDLYCNVESFLSFTSWVAIVEDIKSKKIFEMKNWE